MPDAVTCCRRRQIAGSGILYSRDMPKIAAADAGVAEEDCT
jgi:hypothetical protein